jgi:cation diffusion facilitator CzcD-associated flavoprotein CzcO
MSETKEFDVIVVGAGISGIGAGYRLMTECRDHTFTILEGRDAIGGTWDLFRYPGVRSDSDMFTLGYPFHPWKDARTIADGGSIRDYVEDTAKTFGIDKHIRFRHKIVSATWSSAEHAWTLEVDVGEEKRRERFRCRFLYLCSGYYSYDQAHDPQLAGKERFKGAILHPQWWPKDLDYTGKKVVVIGSGATAVTIVPAMTDRAAHVTMLQRSPTYYASLPAIDPMAEPVRKALPAHLADSVLRAKNVLLAFGIYQYCRAYPEKASTFLRSRVKRALPEGYDVDRHFKPRYNPWDQRLCVVPNNDLFKAIRKGKASVVTDTIETFTEKGIRLSSGEELEADIIVTATGLKVMPVGGIRIEIDGKVVNPAETMTYKGIMLSGVPNLAWCVGYVNASWTLRADLSSRWVCRLLRHMREAELARVVPDAKDAKGERPLLDLTSGYVQRAIDVMPKQGPIAPWIHRQNYIVDRVKMRLEGFADGSLAFTRGPAFASRPPKRKPKPARSTMIASS